MPSVLRGKPAPKRMIGAETSHGALKRSFPRPPVIWRAGAPTAKCFREIFSR
jgi:hypothetical protein